MTALAASPRTLHCSFCTKAAPEVAKLIAGPGVYICDECVELCNGILASAKGAPKDDAATDAPEATALRHWQSQTDDQILTALPKFTQVSAQVDASVQELVDLLRERGVAWSRIGAALGVARQSAWEKYSAAE